MKDKRLSVKKTIENDWYALRLGFSLSKSMVFNAFFMEALQYFEWVFFDAVFLREIVDGLDNNVGFKRIFVFILISGIFFALTNLHCNYAENVIIPLEMTKVYKDIYCKLFNKASNVELRCYEDAEFYNKYTMAMDGADEKILTIIKGINGVIIGAAATAAVFWFMFRIDHYAVLFIICPLLGNFVFGNIKNKYEFKRYNEQAPNSKVLNYVNRTMYLSDYAKEIRLSNIFNLLKKQYKTATDNNVKIARKYAFVNAHMNFWRITFTFTAIFEGVLLYGIYRHTVAGKITLAELTVMTGLMVSMTWILIHLFESLMAIMKSGMFINNFRGFLEYQEKLPENYEGRMPGEFETLEFDNVSFSYKDENTIKNLSFTINKGEIAALVGHNGAGKTTIIKLLLRLYDPARGVIRLNGVDIREYNLHAYRELFATTFQDFAIFGMTIKENVLMGRHYGNDDETVEKALNRAGVLEKVKTLPDGINTMMTKEFEEDGAVLSGGEHQKIAVARTFAMNSPVKIFDEPSSALDPIAEYELFSNIMREGNNHTMLFISHRLSSVKSCDKVFMLENGQLIEEGSHEELMKMNGSYAKMYRRQAMNYLAIEDEKEVAI